LDPRTHCGKGFDPRVYVAQLLFTFATGGGSLADAERLDEDGALKALLGIEKFPDQSALGQWLRNIGTEGVAALRQLNREFVAHILERADPGRHQHCGKTECFFDDTQIEVTGKKFEGAKLNYQGDLSLSWQTLFVGPLLVDSQLGSPPINKESPSSDQAGADVSAALPELLRINESLWNKQEAYLYADSASSAGKYLECVAESFGAWSISYNKWTGPLERGCENLPETAWSALQTQRWRDGAAHECQYAWLRHQPEGCQKPQLFAAVRHRQSGDLFWRYAFVTCQEQDGCPEQVFERHRLKGDRERLLSELLSDLDLHHPPCQNLDANRAFYTLATLCYNAFVALRLIHLPVEDQPKRIRTLIRHLLLIPVEIKRHARKITAAMFIPSGWIEWWKGFLSEFLPRCRLMGRQAGG